MQLWLAFDKEQTDLGSNITYLTKENKYGQFSSKNMFLMAEVTCSSVNRRVEIRRRTSCATLGCLLPMGMYIRSENLFLLSLDLHVELLW